MEIEIEGMEEVRRLISKLDDLEPAKAGLLAAAQHYEGKIKPYPQSTEANQPRSWVSGGNNTWYERGYGPKWARKDGTTGSRKTSETLGRRWTVEKRDQGLTVVVGNNTSYATVVHDEDEQAGFHKRRGWKTAQSVLRNEQITIIRFLEDHIRRALGE